MTQALTVKKSEKMELSAAYVKLREEIRARLLLARERAEEAVEREKVIGFWEVGRMIDRHIQSEKTETEREVYGEKVTAALGLDLRFGKTLFYDSLIMARTYEDFHPGGNLSLKHYRLLIYVKNPVLRQDLETRADAENWPVRTLQLKISEADGVEDGTKKRSAREKKSAPKFYTKRGELNVYRMGPDHSLDLGFRVYESRRLGDLSRFQEGEILERKAAGRVVRKRNATKYNLFTYEGKILRVVDGDTLWVRVELGWGLWTKQKLRLRGIDCPELDTEAGVRAKKFVEGKLKGVTSVVVTTTKPDKFDRYLSDLWIGDVNLNKLLLEKGHACIKTEYSWEDWGE